MAYLGAIGTAKIIDCPKILDVWAASNADAVPKMSPGHRTIKRHLSYWLVNYFEDMAGYISGTVSEEGTPVDKAMVQLFHKRTGICLARTWSAADGSFQFNHLPAADTGQYFVVAHDVPGGTNYKAVIVDQLTPYA